MKLKLMTALLTAATATIFAQDAMPTSSLPVEVTQALAQKNDRDWFGYMRLGLSDSRPTEIAHVLPGLALGVRYALPLGALDLSASYTGTQAFASEQNNYFWTLPRLSYLYYTSPTKQQSFYAGAGLAYAGMKANDGALFYGLVPSASLGYEMNRLESWRSFLELTVSQPAVRMANEAPRISIAKAALGPIAEFSLGFGY